MSTFDYSITYKLNSTLEDDSDCKFINNFEAEVFVDKDSGINMKVGQFKFSVILLSQIQQTRNDLLKTLETQEELIGNCEHFINLETGVFTNKLDEEIKPGNICIIKELDLLPGFRGKKLGAIVLQDFYCRFQNLFSIITIEVIPFQLITARKKWKAGGKLDDFTQSMRYDDGDFDEETAKLKLFAFFQKLGFKFYTKNLFYLNTSIPQTKILESQT